MNNRIPIVNSVGSQPTLDHKKLEPYTLKWGVNRLQRILSIGNPFPLDDESRSKKAGGVIGQALVKAVGSEGAKYAGRAVCLLGMAVNVGCKGFGGVLALKFAGIITFPAAITVSAGTSSILTAVNFYLISEKIGYEIAKSLLGVKDEEELIEKTGIVKGQKAVFIAGLLFGVLGGVLGASLGISAGTVAGVVLGAVGAFVAGAAVGGIVGQLLGGYLIGGIGVGMIAAAEDSNAPADNDYDLNHLPYSSSSEDPRPLATEWQKAVQKPVKAISYEILRRATESTQALYRFTRSTRKPVSPGVERWRNGVEEVVSRISYGDA